LDFQNRQAVKLTQTFTTELVGYTGADDLMSHHIILSAKHVAILQIQESESTIFFAAVDHTITHERMILKSMGMSHPMIVRVMDLLTLAPCI
jgi:hypothetical protein